MTATVFGRLQAVTGSAPAIVSPHNAHLVALGGGGLGGFFVRLLIWHELWRLIRIVWRIHTFGPIIVIVIVAALIVVSVWKPWRRSGPWRGRGGGGGPAGGNPGPRDW